MKPKRTSVDPRQCLRLVHAQRVLEPSRSDVLSDDAELVFYEATAGLPVEVVEELRAWAVFAALAQLTGFFDGLCERLAGLAVAKKLLRVLRSISDDGCERLSREGVSAADLIRAMTLLLPISAEERDGIVAACVRYGLEAARPELARIATAVRDPVLLRVIGLSDESLSSIAKRLGVSPAAVLQREQRMRANLHGRS